MTLSIGLIGCGSIASAHLRGWLNVTDRAKVTAVADISKEAAQRRADEVGGAAVYADYRDMLAQAELDAVDVLLPHHLHKDAIVVAAEAGKHILCEKPLCLSIDEANAIRDALESNGIMLMAAHNQLFMPPMLAAKDYILDGHLGDIYNLQTYDCFRNWMPRGLPGQKHLRKDLGWRGVMEAAGGGELMDTGYHPSYMLLYLANSRPVAITCMTRTHRIEGLPAEDTAYVMVEFANGAIGQIMTSWAFPNPLMAPRFQVTGRHGQLAGDKDTLWLKLHDLSEPAAQTYPQVDGFSAEIAHFVDCLEGKARPIQTHVEATDVLKMILGAYESARTRRTIDLTDETNLQAGQFAAPVSTTA